MVSTVCKFRLCDHVILTNPTFGEGIIPFDQAESQRSVTQLASALSPHLRHNSGTLTGTRATSIPAAVLLLNLVHTHSGSPYELRSTNSRRSKVHTYNA